MKIGVVLDNDIKRDIRVLNELKSLVKVGHEVHILCPATDDASKYEIHCGFKINRFIITKKRRDLLFGINNTIPIYDNIWTKEIKEFVNRNKIDTLHVHDLYMAKAAHMAIKSMNIPMTLDLHENYPEAIKTYTWANTFPKSLFVQPNKWSQKEEEYLNYADNIVVLSEGFRDELLSKYSSLNSKRFVIYPNVPDTKELSAYPIDETIINKGNSFILFYFGVIGVRRGVFTCFEALRLLVKSVPEIKLLLIGPVDKADKAKFDSYLNDPEIVNNIIYYAWKDISLLPSYILISDICLSPLFKNPQHESGLANKIFQYMMFGRPLLVSDCKPQVDLINETGTGLVFENQNYKDMADKVMLLYNNPLLRQQMGQNGTTVIRDKYNLETLSKNITCLYN